MEIKRKEGDLDDELKKQSDFVFEATSEQEPSGWVLVKIYCLKGVLTKYVFTGNGVRTVEDGHYIGNGEYSYSFKCAPSVDIEKEVKNVIAEVIEQSKNLIKVKDEEYYLYVKV